MDCVDLHRSHAWGCWGKPEEGIIASGNGITSMCETPDIGTRNQTHVLCKIIKH